MWRFEATSRKATPKGQPSSLAQHRLLEASLPAHQDLHSSFTAHAPAKCGLVWLVVIGERAGWLWSGHGSPAIIWVSGCRARLPARITASTHRHIDHRPIDSNARAAGSSGGRQYGEVAAAR